MKELDRIPWKNLTHAYGSAEDVPDLLRALKSSSPNQRGEKSPLWHLFGNIWHQGTVYEATAYAVPFLIDIAADSQTRDRAGVLGLLAEIAKGKSTHHEKRAHAEVGKGFARFVALTNERTVVRLEAAHVLAQFPERARKVGAILRGMIEDEVKPMYRAGLLLLLGQSGDRSKRTIDLLSNALKHQSISQRRAAAFSVARLRLRPLPPNARDVMMEAFTAHDLEESLERLPWDVWGEIHREDLLPCLHRSDRDQIADRLITLIEARKATELDVDALVNLLFPLRQRGRNPRLSFRDLSPQQARAVRAMFAAMKGGKRIFHGFFPCWGLPDTLRDWRALANGCESTPVDETLPLLADPKHPRETLPPKTLKKGDRVVHRCFGTGIVTKVKIDGQFTAFTVKFDEEGVLDLSLPSDGR